MTANCAAARPSRGIAYAGTGTDARILAVRGEYLMPSTRQPENSFAPSGPTDGLTSDPGMGPLATNFSFTSMPQVCNDAVLIGAAMTDAPRNKEEPPGKVQAFDVRTGKPRWAFNPIPRAGEVGNETWENDSWAYSGEANVWSLMSADEQLGLAYLPTGAPTNDMYGGHRLGDNLFGNTLVAVKCTTGERVWHFQTVHHDLWDYDNNVAPVLVDITVNGRPVKAVVQLTKQAMAYVLDRQTGKPVWPIEERPVPKSNTPGERTAATQPFPTRPAPFDLHGLTVNDLLDYTPALRAEAVEIAKRYVIGPIFTPPSVKSETGTKGTLQMPGATGGAEWGGAPFDPDTKIMCTCRRSPERSQPICFRAIRRKPISNTRAAAATSSKDRRDFRSPNRRTGRVTAINMNTGTHLWMVPERGRPARASGVERFEPAAARPAEPRHAAPDEDRAVPRSGRPADDPDASDVRASTATVCWRLIRRRASGSGRWNFPLARRAR